MEIYISGTQIIWNGDKLTMQTGEFLLPLTVGHCAWYTMRHTEMKEMLVTARDRLNVALKRISV